MARENACYPFALEFKQGERGDLAPATSKALLSLSKMMNKKKLMKQRGYH